MNFDSKNLSPQEPQAMIGKLHEELKLRKYSVQEPARVIGFLNLFLHKMVCHH